MKKGKCGAQVNYQLRRGVLTISGVGPMWDFAPEELPAAQRTTNYDTPWRDMPLRKVIIQHGVTRIGNGAFCRSKVKAVIMPADTLTEIGDWALADSSIKAVRIPDSVHSIGTHAFFDCKKLRKVSLGDRIQIGSYAFANTGLRKLVYRGELDSTGAYAFWCNPRLTRLKLPLITGELGFGLFADCGLQKVDLSQSGLDTLPDYMFAVCRRLQKVKLPSRLRSLGNNTFMDSGLKEIVIPSTVTEFDPSIFLASELTRIVFLGKNAPACQEYAPFPKNLVIAIPEDEAGFDAPPWSGQQIERLTEEQLRKESELYEMQSLDPMA